MFFLGGLGLLGFRVCFGGFKVRFRGQHGAVFTEASCLLCGLDALTLSQRPLYRIDSQHVRFLRRVMGIKESYHSPARSTNGLTTRPYPQLCSVQPVQNTHSNILPPQSKSSSWCSCRSCVCGQNLDAEPCRAEESKKRKTTPH